MTSDAFVPVRPAHPIDAVTERLNDPAVAAAVVTLLDNAELLSTLVLGLGGMVSRSEIIVDALADGLRDLRTVGRSEAEGAPSLADLKEVAVDLAQAAPALRQVVNSSMTSPATIDLLATFSESAVEGAAKARAQHTEVKGALGAFKAMKEPEVQKGLGLLIEIARALGRRM